MDQLNINGLGLPYGIKSPNKMYSADAYAGPYKSVEQALESIPSPIRVPGRCVGIYKDSEEKEVLEYVFRINEEDEWELIPKGGNVDLSTKLDKPTTQYNGSHINVVVVDPDGNSAIKPLSEFGQSGGEPNVITAIKLNGELLNVENKTVEINITPTVQLSSSDSSIIIEDGDIKINLTKYRKIFNVEPGFSFPIELNLGENVKDVEIVTFNGIILELENYSLIGNTITINSVSSPIFSLFMMSNGFDNKINVIGTKNIKIN